MRAPLEVARALHQHYDLHPHANSGTAERNALTVQVALFYLPGVPLELLQADFWVPGVPTRSEKCGHSQWKQIMSPTGFSALLWMHRLIKDSDSEVRMWARTLGCSNVVLL